MKLGVVGLPNVGKSTLFNAITHAGAECANYPFCTIEPNVGVVAVPDERLDKLAALNTREIGANVHKLGDIFAALADNDKVINKNQLPAQAQKFLNENFANVKCSYVKLERDFLERSYEVVLVDGVKLEFSRNGAWKDVFKEHRDTRFQIICK